MPEQLLPLGGADVVHARRVMVDRLVADGLLHDAAVRRALLVVPREQLLPWIYVLRQEPEQPGRWWWQVLDGTRPQDRAEWVERIHGERSVAVQWQGRPVNAPDGGRVEGGDVTATTSVLSATVATLEDLSLEPGLRVLDAGTGAGVVAALAAHLAGTDSVTTVECDPHVAQAARERLAEAGYPLKVVTGDALAGHPQGAPYDRLHAGFAVRCLPPAWLEQLAPGGLLLATLTTASPFWLGRCTMRRHRNGRLEGEVAALGWGHRPGRGWRRLCAHSHRARLAAFPVRRRRTALAPPGPDEHGLWLALAHLAPGLVQDRQADHLTLIAPGEDSFAAVRPDGQAWQVEHAGQRDIWDEVEALHARWVRAGRPDAYRLEVAADGSQHLASRAGHPLAWPLPAHPLAAEPQSVKETLRR
ncbi:methyltransferase domain-containing protein [Streptomyces aidingensis]|uniref:Protein-L-isoaspartate O-methyltransferase n=1 Tax=Streptomyces aidingensis TaxID=910347 RepID=A0A1I1V9X6_9ACTN|nr:methyltransferase domain-containing protein [Streptomyces aidingensis]SFD79777.1 Protein-L-isoaspartate(D-aspartate) O-methyltransferase (PCMT) [Streptomyces aidingensis]